MKYVATVDLWADGVQDKIRSGELKLQCGQFVRCGQGNKPARFVGVTDRGIFWVAHEQGSPSANAQRFKDLKEAFSK